MNGSVRRRRMAVIGLIVSLLFGGALWFGLNAQQGIPGTTKTMVKAAFTDVGSLRPGDDVRINNVRVGQVHAVNLVNDQPVVTLELNGDRAVFRNASALIGARSALGQKYVELNPGDPGSGPLRNGVIPAAKRGGAQDISDLLQVLDRPTRKALGSGIRELGGGAIGHAQDLHRAGASLPKMLPDLGTVSRALSADSGADTTRLLHAANGLAVSFAGRQQELGQLAGNLGHTLRSVDVDDGEPLATALNKAPETLAHTRTALGALGTPLRDTEAAMSGLRPGAVALGEATPDVRGVLRDAVRPLDKVPGVADRAHPAEDALTGTLRDARPLAPQLKNAFVRAKTPLAAISPYAPEVSLFFSNFADALKNGDSAGHYLRIYPPLGPENLTGLLPLRDPTGSRDAYPAPGQARQEKENSLVGNGQGEGR